MAAVTAALAVLKPIAGAVAPMLGDVAKTLVGNLLGGAAGKQASGGLVSNLLGSVLGLGK